MNFSSGFRRPVGPIITQPSAMHVLNRCLAGTCWPNTVSPPFALSLTPEDTERIQPSIPKLADTN